FRVGAPRHLFCATCEMNNEGARRAIDRAILLHPRFILSCAARDWQSNPEASSN
ncbi:hypothetical protein A2U01_0105729, partial [Trifolium medium]|nr:hypothetical protein [Trifolium medium]